MHSAQLAGMYVVALAECVLLVRLLSLGFHRPGHYPLFTLFLIADLVQTIAGIVITTPFSSPSYWWFWVCSETIVAILQILAAREVWRRIHVSYPGMGKLGRKIVEWSFSIALMVAVASLFFDVFRANWNWAVWSGGLVLRRAIASVLALTVATLTLLMRYAPDPIPANVKRHTRIFAAYLATAAIAILLVAARVMNSESASVLQISVDAIWSVCWILAFRKGQDEPPPRTGTATREDVLAALEQMRSLVGGIRRIRPKIS